MILIDKMFILGVTPKKKKAFLYHCADAFESAFGRETINSNHGERKRRLRSGDWLADILHGLRKSPAGIVRKREKDLDVRELWSGDPR